MIRSKERKILIRACEEDTPDALRWAKRGKEDKVSNRDMLCRIFAAKLFNLMEWDTHFRYRILGRPAEYRGEKYYSFMLQDCERIECGVKRGKTYLPEEWRELFGTPVELHNEKYEIKDTADYITPSDMEKIDLEIR